MTNLPTIPAWSFSGLSTYEGCPYRAKLAKVDKIPEPDRPPPPKGKEHANTRGSRVHDTAELYVRGEAEPCIEMQKFMPEFDRLRALFDSRPENFFMEDMWAFDSSWNKTDPKDRLSIWIRIILDLIYFISPTEAAVVDYKTGKKWGNEIKHAQQGQLYQLAAFLLFPQLEMVHVEFWYLDQDDISRQKFTRKQGLRFLKGWNTRGERMTTDTRFEAKPHKFGCMFCPYSSPEFNNKWVNKSGDCPYGVN